MASDNTPKTRVKVGLTFAPREVELEVEDAEAFAKEFEEVVNNERKVWWVTDREGHRHGLLVEKVAYVDIEPGKDRTIGFG